MSISDITVEEYTSPSIITIGPGADLDEAFALMQEHGIRHLPVVEVQNVLGIISERDVLAHMGKSWDKMLKVEDIMNTSILTARVNDSLGEVAYSLSSGKKGSAIILDEDGALYGIFTSTDALNALVEILYPDAKGRSSFRTTKLF